MENKLQELTRKLYDEGLEKGRAEADKLVADARREAEKIVSDARSGGAEIVSRARAEAEDAGKNILTEVALAGRQAVAKIKSEIASLIVAEATSEGVKRTALDPEFIRGMLLSMAKNWTGDASGRVELTALLPEAERAQLDKAFDTCAKELLSAGVEVGWSKQGGYYISFSDADLEALLSEYLREKVSRMLFKA